MITICVSNFKGCSRNSANKTSQQTGNPTSTQPHVHVQVSRHTYRTQDRCQKLSIHLHMMYYIACSTSTCVWSKVPKQWGIHIGQCSSKHAYFEAHIHCAQHVSLSSGALAVLTSNLAGTVGICGCTASLKSPNRATHSGGSTQKQLRR
jgi:hypothetical protein